MEEQVTQTTEKTPKQAETFAEYKTLREAQLATPAEPEKTKAEETKVEPKSQDTPELPADDSKSQEGKSAADTGTPNKETQEHRRDKKAEARIAELLADTKKRDDEITELRRKLEEKSAAPPARAEEPAKVVPIKADDENPKPRLKEFVDKLKEGETYEDAVERHADAVWSWNKKAEAAEHAKAEGERGRAAARTAWNDKLAAARTKFDDFDTVTASDAKAGTGLLLTPAMQKFVITHPLGLDVAYQLGKDLSEAKRIFGLGDDVLQLAELGAIAKGLTKTAAAATDTPARDIPPRSRITPPGRTVSGASEPGPPKSPSDARNFG